MRRFQLNGTKFSGYVDVTYNDFNYLCSLDFTNSNLESESLRKFKDLIPVQLVELEPVFKPYPSVTIVETEYVVKFEDFFTAYRNKVHKKRAESVWDRLSKIKQIKAINGIKKYDNYLKLNTWRTKADPDTYLRNEMWEDEFK